LICLFIYNRRFGYMSLNREVIELRKRPKGAAKSIPLAEIVSVEVEEEEFDDALAELADPARKAACDLKVVTSARTFLVHAPNRDAAEAARDKVMAAKA
ncbi:MAG: hypothetical protein KDB07_03550, partial [Planctomycetes bacterium]|nr:hypothetical protein [Planctomycetota bacterium]